MRVIGVDIGGTAIKAGFFSSNQLLESLRYPTNAAKGREAVLKQIVDSIRYLIQSQGFPQAIGVVSTGDIDEKGVYRKVHNIPCFEGFALSAALEEIFRVPVYTANDAVGALLCEMNRFPTLSNLVVLTFGTGVGCATLLDGSIVHDERYDYGHHVLVRDGEPCCCGKRGCAESYLSATALKRFAKQAYGIEIKTLDFFTRVRRKEAKALAVFRDYCALLNLLLDDIQKDIHPQKIILGGGVMGAQDVLAPAIRLDPSLYAFSSAGTKAGIVGASLLARKYGIIKA